MEIYTIGFTQKNAARFFGLLREAGIERLLDARLKNNSQLAGFTRRDDLAFFLRELCGADYCYQPLLAPTPDILTEYRQTKDWGAYMTAFNALISERQIERLFPPGFFAVPTVLLCSEPTAEHCHRRLVAEYLCDHMEGMSIVHL
ncbi:MAG: DUF488 domain-containing protein [Armatimonadota bacterium]